MKLIVLTTFLMSIFLYVLMYMPNKTRQYFTDDELRETALSRNMSSIPEKYEDLLKLVDTTNNPITKEKIALGKELYHEQLLSKDRDISCGSCHMLSQKHDKGMFLKALSKKTSLKNDCMVCHLKDESGTDRLATAVGEGQLQHPEHLNTLTTLNSALAKYENWDASIQTPEEQVAYSITNHFMMNLSEKEAVQRLKQEEHYVFAFKQIFGELDFENIKKAIAAYLKTLVTRSSYDRFLDGNNSAMSEEAKRGFEDFIKLGCKGCHTGITVGGQLIERFPLRSYNSIIDITDTFNSNYKGREVSDFGFNINMYHRFPFENRGGFLGKESRQLFRVPILRNVTKTSPYFHNGAITDLREAIYIMGKYQLGVYLDEKRIDELVAFFKSLQGDVVEYK